MCLILFLTPCFSQESANEEAKQQQQQQQKPRYFVFFWLADAEIEVTYQALGFIDWGSGDLSLFYFRRCRRWSLSLQQSLSTILFANPSWLLWGWDAVRALEDIHAWKKNEALIKFGQFWASSRGAWLQGQCWCRCTATVEVLLAIMQSTQQSRRRFLKHQLILDLLHCLSFTPPGPNYWLWLLITSNTSGVAPDTLHHFGFDKHIVGKF